MTSNDIVVERTEHHDGKGFSVTLKIGPQWQFAFSFRPDEGGITWADLRQKDTRNELDFYSLEDLQAAAAMLAKGLEMIAQYGVTPPVDNDFHISAQLQALGKQMREEADRDG